MSQEESTPQEVSPTLWRLTKIYWSQFWRGIFLLLLLFAFIFAYGAYKDLEADALFTTINPTLIETLSNKALIFNYIGWLFFLYLIQSLLFFLILGKTYQDFTFSFVPKLNPQIPGYWPALFYISWAYFWRVTIFSMVFDSALSFFPNFYEITGMRGFSAIFTNIIALLLLRFVVNQRYGNVRLSLLKLEGNS